MGDDDIEQLVEAQARGDTIASADVPVEQTSPPLAELDLRRSKSTLGLGPILGEVAGSAGSDSHPWREDSLPPDTEAADEPVLEETQPVPSELGSAGLGQQAMAIAQELPVRSDEGLGLIFQRNSV